MTDHEEQGKTAEEMEPKLHFPLTVRVLVPYEKRFESKEDFDEFLKTDVLAMGYAVEEADGSLTTESQDREAWEENYPGVPFLPTTVQDFIAYTKHDLEQERYGLDELDFEASGEYDKYQWMIEEDRREGSQK